MSKRPKTKKPVAILHPVRPAAPSPADPAAKPAVEVHPPIPQADQRNAVASARIASRPPEKSETTRQQEGALRQQRFLRAKAQIEAVCQAHGVTLSARALLDSEGRVRAEPVLADAGG